MIKKLINLKKYLYIVYIMNSENILLIVEKIKRGRPKKVINESEEKEVKQRIPRGRPRKLMLDMVDMVQYRKTYYANNKDKYVGDFTCPHCNFVISLSNKSRHNKKHHSDVI